jgi:hypothetical protein
VAIDTFSSFYWLQDEITTARQNINFNEGAGELSAQVAVGAYTPTELSLSLKTALDAAGTQEYFVTFNRDTRRYTISAASNFDLLVSSGSQIGTSPFTLIGFTGADKTGSNSYTSNIEVGSAYYPQFKLQEYVAPGFFKQKIDPSVNEAASGILEVLTFGTRSLVRFRIPFVSNAQGLSDCRYILPDSNGVQNTLSFLDFLITKSKIEFNPDRDNASSEFYTLILETTGSGGDGTSYILRERTDESLRDVYDTGLLTFRVAE